MNSKQINWASKHDWFIRGNEAGVLVRDVISVDGVAQENIIQINDFEELTYWAGY